MWQPTQCGCSSRLIPINAGVPEGDTGSPDVGSPDSAICLPCDHNSQQLLAFGVLRIAMWTVSSHLTPSWGRCVTIPVHPRERMRWLPVPDTMLSPSLGVWDPGLQSP